MNRLLRRSLAGAMLLAPVVLAAQTQVTGAGASFPYPMYDKWFQEYKKAHADVQINYQSIGSGGGIRQVTEGTVDFGASDGPMTEAQLADFKTKRGGDILHFPTVMGAVVPIYNIPGVATALKFTPAALAGIYLGTITKWNDAAISGPNKGVKLPSSDIVVVHRSDASGTTYVWTDCLTKVSPVWKDKVGVTSAPIWPVGLGGAQNAGDERVGDHAVNIGQSALRMVELRTAVATPPEIEHESVFRILLTHMMEDPATITAALELLLVSRNLERVADLAANVAEDAVYLAEGKTIKHHMEDQRLATPPPLHL